MGLWIWQRVDIRCDTDKFAHENTDSESKCYAICGAEHPSDSSSDETTNGCTDKASGKAPMETHDSTEKISCTARESSPQEDQSRSAVYSGVSVQETKLLFAILP